jgi:hypothetical protein
LIDCPLAQRPDVRILFPRAPDRINNIIVLNYGVPCSLNKFTRRYDMVTKVFLDDRRRGFTSASKAEADRLDLARSFDKQSKITKLNPSYLCRLTQQDLEFMQEQDISLGHMPPVDRERLRMLGDRPLLDKPMLQTPKVGNNLSFLVEHQRLHCNAGFNMIVRLSIPFIKGLFECNQASNMLHNDVSSLNVCLDEIEGRLYLIDFEKLAPRATKSVHSDIAGFFRGVIMDLAFLANAEQRRYLERVRRISVDDLTVERLVTILENTLKLESLDDEMERLRRNDEEIRKIESMTK